MFDEENYTYLQGEFNAQVWAKAWCEIALKLTAEGKSLIDEGWMIGWFANAIMTGYDHYPKSGTYADAIEDARNEGYDDGYQSGDADSIGSWDDGYNTGFSEGVAHNE